MARTGGAWRSWCVALTGAALIAVTAAPLAASDCVYCGDCCYEDVVVNWDLPDTTTIVIAIAFTGQLCGGYPVYSGSGVFVLGSDPFSYVATVEYVSSWELSLECDSGGGQIEIWADLGGETCETPPPFSAEDPYIGTLSVSGGEVCSDPKAYGGVELAPAGAAGFLDRGFPEGEEPPVVGELVVSATYEVGELVTGCCSVTGDVSYVTLTWYAVTIGTDFDVRDPIDSKIVHEDDGAFCFEIDTEGWSPGYYDIRLGIPGECCEWIRVEVVPPAE